MTGQPHSQIIRGPAADEPHLPGITLQNEVLDVVEYLRVALLYPVKDLRLILDFAFCQHKHASCYIILISDFAYISLVSSLRWFPVMIPVIFFNEQTLPGL